MFRSVKKMLAKIKNRQLRWLLISFCFIAISMVIFVVALFTYTYSLGPPALTNNQNTVYYSQNGKVIGEEHGLENRYWVGLDHIDEDLIQATLTTEDRNFYNHPGFDFKRILGAAIQDIRSLSMEQGASTITQQYARNLYLTHDKTWKRKIKEAFYTIRLEMFYSKDEILEGYLNTIYYGHGAYGVEAASRYFFDKSANDLSIAEAAMLAAIPKGPSYYSPFNHAENAERRKNQIVANLAKQHVISEAEADAAMQEALSFTEPNEQSKKAIAPYFQDEVLRELQHVLNKTKEEIRSGGYQVYTTLHIDKQLTLEKTVEKTISSDTELQVGALAVNHQTGAILSMVGGKDYNESPFNRAVQAKRMPGSTFKPFLYYAALENGYTPTTTLMSKPTDFELANGTVYQPSNYNGYYADEPITLAEAIALSDNIYAVKTNLFLTPERLVETAKQFGIKSNLQPYPSLALGTASVSVKEMTRGYSMIANGGKEIDPYTIEKVTDAEGNVLYERPEKEQKSVFDPRQTFILTHLMTGMFDESLSSYMRVTGAAISDELGRQYAGKSGTTKTDSWMIGFSPEVVTSVWTGYDNNIPIEKTKEQRYAKQIWAGYMEKIHEGKPLRTFQVPDGVVGAYVDTESGNLATPYCDNHRLMYFLEGTEPTSYCTAHKPDDAESGLDDKKEKDSEDKRGFFKRLLDFFR
ncbi:transglycosylase domain-containing protein [Aquibacillus albus]|uniref:1A family penicillin-binding protein n=1 Tax=Aquibacillus albus TaxID=1168171 RepID=A0ABS2MX92_9BACI|nr:PBP1A family penicillin-binding protein [Aquibacillus albus]MBM7570500.1 1A family penicillin-binding protein [Aquibacillus albus]